MKMIVAIVLMIVGITMHGSDLIDALMKVESSGNIKAIGDKGKAKGCLQIWSVVVDDVNKVYKTKFKHNDMFKPVIAKKVCKLYLAHYGKVYYRNTGVKPTNEVLARIWNGGPRGWEKDSTLKYWLKVKSQLA